LKIGGSAKEEQLGFDGLWGVGKNGWVDWGCFGLGGIPSVRVTSSVGRCLPVRLLLVISFPLVALSFVALWSVVAIAMEGTGFA
jgi:hypothetical protein